MLKPVSSKVDFPKLERELLKKWYKKSIVEKYLHKNDKSAEKFSFLDGPITANNPMGVHHAWGRTYKDFWQRFWNMNGKRQRFQNGFDEQGLWVEVEVEKELGLKNKKDIENLVPGDKFKSLEKFINLCKKRVEKFSQIQTEQSKRLGYFMDWDNSYHTSSSENNYAIWNFLKVIFDKGWLYKGRDSVPWCPRCGTAISQHEILTEEYKEISHETIFFRLPVIGKQNTYLLVWTTTPWTIPANVAVGFNSKYDYGIWKDGISDEKYIFLHLGEERKPPVRTRQKDNAVVSLEQWIMDETGRNLEHIEDIPRENLSKLKYEAPFDNLDIVKKAKLVSEKNFHNLVDAGEVITDTDGTGLLHIAPGAGEEDFKLGKEYGMTVIAPIEEDATYISEMGVFSGKNAKQHPEIIIDYLKQFKSGKFLFKVQRITHRYPTCWRCKTELVWRVVDEWYIAMDTPSKSKIDEESFREQMIEVVKQIEWMPDWGLDRELDWLSNMHDWLISKKRYWGLALPIWECERCGKFEVIGGYEELKRRAVEGFEEFEGNSPHRPWIDKIKIKCSSCSEIISRIPDVGNPWLDAGIIPFSTLPKDWFPADFITESFPGQFKNWFYSLIAMSTALKRTNPFKRVLGFGSVRDEKGQEMHKSRGNAIEFTEAADKIGVDVMRWLYLRTNPEHNVNFGYHATDKIRRFFHLRLWNVYSFFVQYSNIDNYQALSSKYKVSKNVLDRWIVSKLNQTIKIATDSIEKYDAQNASLSIENFVNDLSLWYVRRSRDRVGPASLDSKDRESCYNTLFSVLSTLAKLLALFIPFIADEIYTNLTKEESVHLTDWPLLNKSLIDKNLEKEMQTVREIVELAHSKRKEKRIKVRQPLQKIKIQNSKFKIDEEILQILKAEVNVKEVELKIGLGELKVDLDTEITPELKKEGEAREILRLIQEERKKLGTKLNERVDVFLKSWPKDMESYIKNRALVRNIKKGSFGVLRINE